MTVVEVDGKQVMGLHGHLPRDQALLETRLYVDEEISRLKKIRDVLFYSAPHSEEQVKVFHQRGIHVARNRREVSDPG